MASMANFYGGGGAGTNMNPKGGRAPIRTPYDDIDPNQRIAYGGGTTLAGDARNQYIDKIMTGSSYRSGDVQTYKQYDAYQAPQAPQAAAAAPAPRRASKPRPSALTAPAPAPFKQAAPTQKERDEVTPPAKGLEATIKTSPKLLRERRRRSYLTS